MFNYKRKDNSVGERKPRSKNKVSLFLESDPEAQKRFKEFQQSLKGTTSETVNTTNKSLPEGELGSTGEQENKDKKVDPPAQPFNADETAGMIAGCAGLICNMMLVHQGKAELTVSEISVYKYGITDFVRKREAWFKNADILMAVVSTAGLVYTVSKKEVVNHEKYQAYMDGKGKKIKKESTDGKV